MLVEANEWGGQLAAMVSEEMAEPYQIPNRYPKGEFLLLYDPLDGSSNLDVNISVGTIFSVLRCPGNCSEADANAFLQPGSKQVAAGFRGLRRRDDPRADGRQRRRRLHARPRARLVRAHRRADPDPRRHPGVRDQRVEHAQLGRAGEALHRRVPRRQGTAPRGKDFNMRWVASMVADVYRILCRGGIFLYPKDAKHKEGRLRLMYEANPMAFIVEQAGGAATDGTTAHPRHPADRAAPARRRRARLEERGRARHALSHTEGRSAQGRDFQRVRAARPAPQLRERRKLPVAHRHQQRHRRALPERQARIVVVQVGEFARDAASADSTMSALELFESMPFTTSMNSSGAVEARAEEFVVRLVIEEALDRPVRQPREGARDQQLRCDCRAGAR